MVKIPVLFQLQIKREFKNLEVVGLYKKGLIFFGQMPDSCIKSLIQAVIASIIHLVTYITLKQ